MAKYKQRIADRLLERKILGKGAVLIEGPKWCGKTTTEKQLAKSVLDLGDASVLKQSIISHLTFFQQRLYLVQYYHISHFQQIKEPSRDSSWSYCMLL